MTTRRSLLLALAALLAAGCGKDAKQAVSSSSDAVSLERRAAAGTRPLAAPAPPVAEGGITGAAAAKDVATFTDIAPAAQQTPGTLPQTYVQSIANSAMMIRTGTADVEVDSVESAVGAARALANRVGGYIANVSYLGGRDQQRSATIELRIPSGRFDDAVGGLAPLGRVQSVNVTAQDVGEEYVDVTARVANARRLEQRLIALLAGRTGKLSDVLEVEQELARVREEIERYEGRLRYLSSRASVSTLTVSLHQRAPIVHEYRTARILADAFGEAWRNFIGVLAGFIALLGVLVPLLALAGAALFVIVRIWRPLAAGSHRAAPVLAESRTET